MNDAPLSKASLEKVDKICSQYEDVLKTNLDHGIEHCLSGHLENKKSPFFKRLFAEAFGMYAEYRFKHQLPVPVTRYRKEFNDMATVIDAIFLEEKERDRLRRTNLAKQKRFKGLPKIVEAEDGTPRFKLLELIGQGGMGSVYRATDLRDRKEVAVKTLQGDSLALLERFKNEFRALTMIDCEHLVKMNELLVVGLDAYISMRLEQGKSFHHYVWGQGRFPKTRINFELIRQLLVPITKGIWALHVNGKIHCDIKPNNVLVRESGELILLDFGLAIDFGPGRGIANGDPVRGGTDEYASPEQWFGETIMHASDWYSLGVMLYETVTGLLPGVPKLDVPIRPSEINADVPDDIEDLILQLLSLEPRRRVEGGRLLKSLLAHTERGLPYSIGRYYELQMRSTFVGRGEELSKLHELVTDTRRDGFKLFALSGQSGVGKTELAKHFLEQCEEDRKAVVFCSACYPLESMLFKALDGIVTGLATYLEKHKSAFAPDTLPEGCHLLFHIFPRLGRVLELNPEPDEVRLLSEREKRRLAAIAFWKLLGRVGEQAPCILWIDDFQWTDRDSIEFLLDGMGGAPVPRLLLFVTYREEGMIESHLTPLKERIGQERFIPMELLPLDEKTLETFFYDIVGQNSGVVFKEVAAAAGSLYWLKELAYHIVRLPEEERRLASKRDFSTFIRHRLEQLSEGSRSLLEFAVLAGEPIWEAVAVGLEVAEKEIDLALWSLFKGSFLSWVPLKGRDAFSPKHDLLRKEILATIPKERIKGMHSMLARAFERVKDSQVGTLFHHFYRAEEFPQAAVYAKKAGELAMEKLSFLQAADLFKKSLELNRIDDAHAFELLEAQATAWKRGGHGLKAGEVFEEAARCATGEDKKKMLLMATEQYLWSGHLEEGTRILEPLMEEYSIRYPKYAFTMGVAVVRLGLQLRLKPPRLPDIEQRKPMTDELSEQSDCLHILSKGMMAGLPLQASYFALHNLIKVAPHCDEKRLARELFVFSWPLLLMPGPMALWGERLLNRASKLEETVDAPALKGAILTAQAVMQLYRANWHKALDLCKVALPYFQERKIADWWEHDYCQLIEFTSLQEMGDYPKAIAILEESLRDGNTRGNQYVISSAHTNLGFCYSLQGLTEASRRHTDAVFKIIGYPRFWKKLPKRARTAQAGDGVNFVTHKESPVLFVHFPIIRSQVYCDLGEGNIELAWQRVDLAWSTIKFTQFWLIPLIRGDMYVMRGRVLLARFQQASKGAPRMRLSRQIKGVIRKLEKSIRLPDKADAELLRAGLYYADGDIKKAKKHLEAASKQLLHLGIMAAHHAARIRLAQIDNAVPEDEWMAKYLEQLKAFDIQNVNHYLRIVTPAFPDVGVLSE